LYHSSHGFAMLVFHIFHDGFLEPNECHATDLAIS
jgi:hypothetical protein